MADVTSVPAAPAPVQPEQEAKHEALGIFLDAPSEHSIRKVSSASQVQPLEVEPGRKKPTKKRNDTMVKIADQRHTHDEEWLETHEAELQAAELIEYMKDNWNVEVDRTSSLIEMAMRTIEISHHQRPENHWILKRAQEKEAEHTGFFSSVRRPYSALGPPELDTAMLVFRNLPDTLRIDCAEWIETQFARAEAIRKANALLPRIPHVKTTKPRYFRGRIKKGAGGSTVVDKFVQAAEQFQRGIRGSMTYTKLLEQWKQHKEDEAANRGSAFGIVKRTVVTPPTPMSEEAGSLGAAGTSGTVTPGSKQKKGKDGKKKGRKSSVLDDKVYQVEMLNLEKMIGAMYDIIKSMLNIKQKQLRSDLRLAHVTVMQLRDHSPETRLRRKKTLGAAEMLKKRRTPRLTRKAQPEVPKDFGDEEEEEDEDEEEEEEEEPEVLTRQELILKTSHARMGKPAVRPDLNAIFKDDKKKYKGTGHVVPKPFNPVTAAEVYPLSEASSAELMPVAIDRVKTIIDSATYLDDRPFELLSATVEREPTAITAQRNLKNDERFRNIFDRKSQPPEPIWHDVKVRFMNKTEHFLTDTVSGRRKGSPTSPSMVDFGLHGNTDTNMLQRTAKIPNEADILTPNLPGAIEEEILDSEEQSRVNLLAKIPGAAHDAPPPSPIRRLLRESGIKTTDKEMFTIIMGMKRPFRQSEKNLRQFYTNEAEKFEWDTMKRYKAKVQAIFPDPIYEYSIATMREFALQLEDEEVEDETTEKRPALWYRELLDKCESMGAMKHHGCNTAIHKLHKFCDVDTKSRPQMLNRFCLLVISLPTNELGTPYFQQALKFLLDRLFGSPKELLYEWLSYRGLPYLC